MGNTASNIQQQQQSQSSSSGAVPPAGCPMHKQEESSSSNGDSSVLSQLNPLNNIPALSQSPTSAAQKTLLSLERTTSSIPRVRSDSSASASASGSACPVAHGDKGKGKATAVSEEEGENWVYPSPQQFYNALARKGKEAPEESIDMMVNIHNWLNEKAWDEVKRWEDRRDPNVKIELAKFEGKPDILSPKARFHLFLGSLFPNTYNSEPPFDRHDWHIRRHADGTFQRYVIDYYSCPDDENGEPVFSLDVRPAVDSPGAVYERMTEWARVKKETWLQSEQQTQQAGRRAEA